MRPYSNDLRERIVAAIDRGDYSLRELAQLFSVSLSFLVRLLQRRRATGSVQPKPHGGGPTPLTDEDLHKLKELLLQGPTSHGWCNELWTCARVKEVIKKHFGVDLSSRSRLQDFEEAVELDSPKAQVSVWRSR